jgi:hypothetical protein
MLGLAPGNDRTTVLWNAFLSARCAEPAGGLWDNGLSREEAALEPLPSGGGRPAEPGPESRAGRGERFRSGPPFSFRREPKSIPSFSHPFPGQAVFLFFLANYLILLARPTGIEPVFPP